MKALDAALDIFADIDLSLVRQKSMALTEFFIECIGNHEAIPLVSPRDASERGSQVSLSHDEAYAIVQALAAQGIVGDFREPSFMRFGFSPLYTSYKEVEQAAAALVEVIDSGRYLRPEFQERKSVT